MAALVVLIVVVGLTAPLADVPLATLGATLVFVATKLFRYTELRTILRVDRLELIVISPDSRSTRARLADPPRT
jgi:MFS superfamily sulfate permease-like transporter